MRQYLNSKYFFLPAIILFAGCNSWFSAATDPYTKSCGIFSLASQSNKPPNFPVPELRTTVNFTFNPAKCGKTCNCQQIAFVQMIRFTDQTDNHAGENFQPSGSQEDRMIKQNPNAAFNGWAIDRADDHVWAFYGRNNDGSFDDLAHDPTGGLGWHIQVGSNTKDAIIKDAIHDERSKYRVDVVIVPVCIDPNSSCNQQILGYFGYSFIRTENAVSINPATAFTYNWMVEAFDLAVLEWNKQDGKNKLNLVKIP